MKGFDANFTDFPDYILKITEEIWERRGLTTLYRYYSPDVIMRTPTGIVRGNQAVIDDTMAALIEFPDRQLLGEDVIWSGDDEAGFLSSHRVLTTATHTGSGMLGPPTGRRVTVRAIADCAAKNNVIYDEWLTRDTSALVLQLGLDPCAHARNLIERARSGKLLSRAEVYDTNVQGLYQGYGNKNPWGQKLVDIVQRIMTKDFAVIHSEYDRAVWIEHPGLCVGWGRSVADSAWMRIRSAFPTASFDIHHVIGREDAGQPVRAAVRWSLSGSHDGYGAFGAPTGAKVNIMGITHAEWGPWGLRREYTVFDEIAIWKQIHLQTGAHD